jgi:drug/metabolite transporter (DMT)-like permease
VAAGVTATVLLAAVLHASWNALLKAIPDRLTGFALIDLTGTGICLVAVWFVDGPARASWGWLALSLALQVVYKLFLMGAYRTGDLSQVYPLARGSGPLLVAAFAATVLHERLGPAQALGVLVISAGLAFLAFERGLPAGAERSAVGYALATGVLIAGYTIADGLGVRSAGQALSYIVWLFVLDGIVIPPLALVLRRRALTDALRSSWRQGVAAGVLAMCAYGLVVWAQSRGALAVVAALRESSVVVAALLGALLFGEPFGRRRVLAAAAVACGVVLVNLP